MIREIMISGFRCFREIHLKDLGLINVIVGPSGSGKTVLLEAISLGAAGSPTAYFQSRVFRGIPFGGDFSVPGAYESLWRELFFDLKPGQASISLLDDHEGDRTLVVNPAAIPRISLRSGLKTVEYTPMTFTWMSKGSVDPVSVDLDASGQLSSKSVPAWKTPYLGASSVDLATLADMFSELSVSSRDLQVVEAVKSAYPQLVGLSVQLVRGMPALFAQTSNLEQKMPLGDVSSGLTKLVAILLCLSGVAVRAVLVDEIENGFYHRDLPSVLKALVGYAQRANVQLFFTTHSEELLRRLVEAAQDEVSSIRLIRTNRVGRDFRMKQFDGLDLQAAVEEEVEVR